ncbi:hypothetical protein F4808DRAFT_414031 [Astrocystis sublimbata]|nr:hypothetical protein F4808DRAFT_414031 [Astrocystis sublimbata]
MENPTNILVDELCALLDEATILSISSDYNLQKPEEFAAARQVLLAISENVEAEEATGFNPSAFSAHDFGGISSSHNDASDAISAKEGDLKSNDGLTTTTETSHSQSDRSGSSPTASAKEMPGILHVSILDGLTNEEKETRLAAMFVSLKPIDVKLTLQKTKGDADLAMDELLNLQWLEQTGQRLKGIDGFYVSDDDVHKAKRKGRRNAKRTSKILASKSTDTANSSEESNRSETVDNDNIGFISDRMGLPISEATALYQNNKCSLGAAILAYLDRYIALDLEVEDSHVRQRQIEEQKTRIPWIPNDYFGPVFSTTVTVRAAIDVIDALSTYFDKPAYLKHAVAYNVVASDVEFDTEISAATHLTSPTKTQFSQRFRAGPSSLQEASATKATIAASAAHSRASASSAFKKGNSNPLMRAAGAFYADRARSEAASHRGAISAEAEFLVDQQSTRDTVDLHGVTVQDGVAIALDRVWCWWESLPDEDRARKVVRHGGLKVVTGLGRHNPDGKSRLRINVCKALVADGWRVEVLTGAYLVIGRMR